MNTHATHHPRPTLRRTALGATATATAAAAFALLAVAPAANAHVGISTDSNEAGSYTVATVSVPHGCGTSSTTKVAIQIPEEVTGVTPTRNNFYTLEIVREGGTDDPAKPITELVYTANTPLPHDQRDTFEISLRLPDEAAGETLFFPTVQTCEEGESAWVQIPADGQDPHELELPSPSIEVVAASSGGSGGHGASDGHGDAGSETEGDAAGSDGDGADASTPAGYAAGTSDHGGNRLAIAGLALGGFALIAAVFALFRVASVSRGAGGAAAAQASAGTAGETKQE